MADALGAVLSNRTLGRSTGRDPSTRSSQTTSGELATQTGVPGLGGPSTTLSLPRHGTKRFTHPVVGEPVELQPVGPRRRPRPDALHIRRRARLLAQDALSSSAPGQRPSTPPSPRLQPTSAKLSPHAQPEAVEISGRLHDAYLTAPEATPAASVSVPPGGVGAASARSVVRAAGAGGGGAAGR